MNMGPQGDDLSVATIHRSIDEGVNWIDVAPVYGMGHGEEIVGRAVSDRRDRVFIATKCVRRFGPDGPYTSGDPAGIRDDIEASLRRLRVDSVDLLQIHHPPPDVPVEESWTTLVDLQREGKTRLIGVSNFDIELTKRCMAVHNVDSVQPQYSVLNRAIEDDVLPYCTAHAIAVLPYWVLAEGLLTGTFDLARLSPGDSRRRPDFVADLPRAAAIVEQLRPIAAARDATVGQVATAWVASHPAVTSAIVGARSPEQATANAAAMRLVGPELREAVDEALTAG